MWPRSWVVFLLNGRVIPIIDVKAIPLVRKLDDVFLGDTYRITSRNTLVTEVWTDDGVVGRAFGGDEWRYQNEIVRVIEEHFKPLLIGEDIRDVEKPRERMCPRR